MEKRKESMLIHVVGQNLIKKKYWQSEDMYLFPPAYHIFTYVEGILATHLVLFLALFLFFNFVHLSQ